MTKLIEYKYDKWLFALESTEALLRRLAVPRFYIAGGYLRDIFNGQPWKDIDVFIPNSPFGLEFTDDMALVYDVNSAEKITHEGREINLVGLHDDLDLAGILGRMDIALCQIGYDPKDGKVYTTKGYLEDVKNRRITVIRPSITDGDREHLARVQAKYPEFRPVFGA